MTGAGISPAAIGSHQKAFRAVLDWKKDSFQVLHDYFKWQGGLAHVDAHGNTILHFLAINGNESAFKELSVLLSREMLKKGNFKGNTTLHEAARFGRRKVVGIILKKDKGLALARNSLGETPLYVAVASGKKDVFDCLMELNKDNVPTPRNDGCTILHAAVIGEYYSLALEIVNSFPNLAQARDEKGLTALNLLASRPHSFKSRSAYSFLSLGSRSYIPVQLIRCLIYLCIPPTSPLWLTKLTSVSNLLRGVDDIKQKHALAVLLAKRLIGDEDWSRYTYGESTMEPYKDHGQMNVSVSLQRPNLDTTIDSPKNIGMRNPLFQAVENSIEELVEEILERFPDAAYTVDENGKNVLHIAVEKKDKRLYDYLKTKVQEDVMLTAMDNQGNTILHLATKQGNGPRIVLDYMTHMAWDVCWFKRIWYDSPPNFQYHRNIDGKTAFELFQENHVSLREKAEKTLKDMNNGLMLVATLIGAVNYATLFTIPGGFVDDKNSASFGRPKFFSTKKEDQVLSFLWYTGVALFSALIALTAMLLIQLSRFTNNDFFMILPVRYLGSLAALFISTIFTIAACAQAYVIIEINVNPYKVMWPAIGFLIFISTDVVYRTFHYLYFAFCCSVLFAGREVAYI
ncbi:uncharacterized protein LOC127790705 isoform X2 [Diospyros lotus]|uniref:uncharacterized protein LOC127790705 isoform X2 n=1 Tax=Diospyros lotus TaxID=55363 RepID=UPI002250F45B|nr:uncharacterized protein LOC127790705 isoform X2 [Diospyros lotus]